MEESQSSNMLLPLQRDSGGYIYAENNARIKIILEKPIDQRSPQEKSTVSNAKVTICIFWTNETRESRSK
jgi:hypothetical protein